MQDLNLYLKRIFKTPILLVFFLICIVFLPSAINLRSVAFRTGIVVGLGIDTNENKEYILDAIITVPSVTDNLTENNKIVSSSGSTILEALGNMNLVFGRAIRLGHVRYILIGSNLAKTNVANAIDGIIRTNKVRDSVQLLVCGSNVHKMLQVGVELKNKTGIRLSDIICHQEQYSTTSFDSNVDSFYKGFFGKSKISKLNYVSIKDDFTIGVAPIENTQNENSGGGGETSQTNKKTKYISNLGEMAIFKDGIMQMVLDEKMSESINWLNQSYLPKKLVVEVEDIDTINTIGFEILDKNLKMETFFIKNVPIIYYKINLTIDINEIINSDSEVVPKSNDIVRDIIKTSTGRTIRKSIGVALDFARQTGLDVFGFNDIFYLYQHDKYLEYCKSGHSEDFLENVQLNVDLNIKII